MGLDLYPHNREAYDKLTKLLQTNGKACLIQPTGTGKAFIAFKYLLDHPNLQAVWVTPSRNITRQQWDALQHTQTGEILPNTRITTYSQLMVDHRRNKPMPAADLIILDEFHHCGAQKWGEGVQQLLDKNPNAQLIGLSATPIRYKDDGRDMSDELFDRHIASAMTLSEAWIKGILPTPTYVLTAYDLADALEKYRRRISQLGDQRKPKAELTYEKLRRLVQSAAGVDDILATYLKPDAHVIVFCTDLTKLRELESEAAQWFGKTNPNGDIHTYRVHTALKGSDANIRKFALDGTPNAIKILYCVNKLNEGIHLPNVDAIIMARPTESPVVYLQQLGRALETAGNHVPVVFDLVNNFNSIGFGRSRGEIDSYGYQPTPEGAISIDPDLFNVVDTLADARKLAYELERKLHMTLDDKIQYVIEQANANTEEWQRIIKRGVVKA